MYGLSTAEPGSLSLACSAEPRLNASNGCLEDGAIILHSPTYRQSRISAKRVSDSLDLAGVKTHEHRSEREDLSRNRRTSISIQATFRAHGTTQQDVAAHGWEQLHHVRLRQHHHRHRNRWVHSQLIMDTMRKRYPQGYYRATCIKCGAVYRVCTRLVCSKDQKPLKP